MSTRQSAARNPPHILMVTDRARRRRTVRFNRARAARRNEPVRFATLRGLGFGGLPGIDTWLV